MRQTQFPDVYTVWDKLKDIKPKDVGYLNKYLQYIAANRPDLAGDALKNLENKYMQTADWQERIDVCDEMKQFVAGKAASGNWFTDYSVSSTAPNTASEGYIWIDTATISNPCSTLTLNGSGTELHQEDGEVITITAITTGTDEDLPTTDKITWTKAGYGRSYAIVETGSNYCTVKTNDTNIITGEYAKALVIQAKCGSITKTYTINIYRPTPYTYTIVQSGDSSAIKSTNPLIYVDGVLKYTMSEHRWSTYELQIERHKKVKFVLQNQGVSGGYYGYIHIDGTMTSEYDDTTHTRWAEISAECNRNVKITFTIWGEHCMVDVAKG